MAALNTTAMQADFIEEPLLPNCTEIYPIVNFTFSTLSPDIDRGALRTWFTTNCIDLYRNCTDMYPIVNYTFPGLTRDNEDYLRAWYTKNCMDCSVQQGKVTL